MDTMFFILQLGSLILVLICVGLSVIIFSQAMNSLFITGDLRKVAQKITFLVVVVLLTVTNIYLLRFLDTTRNNLSGYQARAAARQQEEVKRLSAPVNIQPWGCIPRVKCEKSDSEAVALADSEGVSEIGLNRVLVKRNSDGIQFAIMLSGTRNVKKGEKVQVVTASYWISATRAEMLIIGK